MSYYDDTFDVGAALKGKPEAKCFDKIMATAEEAFAYVEILEERVDALEIVLMDKVALDKQREHFAKLGAKGGSKSKRELDPEKAREMVRKREEIRNAPIEQKKV